MRYIPVPLLTIWGSKFKDSFLVKWVIDLGVYPYLSGLMSARIDDKWMQSQKISASNYFLWYQNSKNDILRYQMSWDQLTAPEYGGRHRRELRLFSVISAVPSDEQRRECAQTEFAT